jgi:hypothetical protein
MNMLATAISVLTLLTIPIYALEIKEGSNIDEVKKAMKLSGYKECQLAMLARERKQDLAFWLVDEGTLIVRYSLDTKKILGITYWMCDERDRSSRMEFNLKAKAFDTTTGVLTLQLNQPKGEQAGSSNGG